MTGIVKWFDGKKGFGFITPDGGGEDVFVHHTAIDGKGWKLLEQGQQVDFRVERGQKGPKAADVRVTNAAPTGHALPLRQAGFPAR